MTQLFAVDPLSAGIEYLPGELLETRMPILERRHELVQDSGGAGEFRGGLSASAGYELHGPGRAVSICEKSKASKVRGLPGHDAPHGNAVIMFPGPTGSCSSGSGPTRRSRPATW